MSPIDFFDNLRFWNNRRSKLLNKLKIYSIANRVTDFLANITLPIYFKLTAKKSQYKLSEKHEGQQVIVSITSYPLRIPNLWKTIECLLRQSVKPDRIVLYLTKSQVLEIDRLPQSLLKMRERGLEIRLCEEEIRSHTKYYPAMLDFPNDIIVTVDDDLYYRTDLLENNLKWHVQYPNAIIANWAKNILSSSPKYRDWPDVIEPGLSNHYLLLGVGSVLYPPHCLYQDVFKADLIKELCLTADDVWLSCMALLAHTPIYFTGYKKHYLPVWIKNNTTLISVNKERNQKCVDNLNSYYYERIKIRPFVDFPVS